MVTAPSSSKTSPDSSSALEDGSSFQLPALRDRDAWYCFDCEREYFPSRQECRGPPAHGRSAARTEEPAGDDCFRAAIRVNLRRERPDYQPARDDTSHGAVGRAWL